MIILAVIVSLLFGCSRPEPTYEPMLSSGGIEIVSSLETSEDSLARMYVAYNDLYFDNKLPTETKVFYTLGGENMADTECDDSGRNCVMRFNPHYTAANRVAEATMLHEMCHVKVWTRLLESNRPPMVDQRVYDHSKPWQSCMLSLDSMGAFRQINIDLYQGK